MRRWILALLIALCAAPLMAQDTPPESAVSTVFFLAREDTDQDGQVTDIDNMRLYQVDLEGTVLFVTPPEQHVLMFTNLNYDDGLNVVVLAQTPANQLAIQVYNDDDALDREIVLDKTRQVEWVQWQYLGDNLVWWNGQREDGMWQVQQVDLNTGEITFGDITPGRLWSHNTNAAAPVLEGRYHIIFAFTGGQLLQRLDAEHPLDALWIYDRTLEEPFALKTLILVEPILFEVDESRLFVLGREFDGSMSLYSLDFSSGLSTPTITPILTGLIDPPYVDMRWVKPDATLLLIGESGDFVVTNIGQPQAIYGLNIATGTFIRLSPEGTFVDQHTIRWR